MSLSARYYCDEADEHEHVYSKKPHENLLPLAFCTFVVVSSVVCHSAGRVRVALIESIFPEKSSIKSLAKL